jgi:hypothetical protein
MQYSYSKKFFARDLFDAVKARLQEPVAGLPAMPPHWPSLIYYGQNPTGFSRRVKFRARHGTGLNIASVPLCSRNPLFIGSLPRSSAESAAILETKSTRQTATASGPVDPGNPPFDPVDLWAQHESLTASNASPVQGPPKDGFSHGAIAQDRDEPLPRPSRIPTAVFTTLLSIAAAITAGIAISNTDTFKFGDGTVSGQRPADALAAAATGAATTQSASRLTLEPTFPAAYRVTPETARPTPESRSSANKKPGAASRGSVSRQSKNATAHASRKTRTITAKDSKKTATSSSRNASAGKSNPRPVSIVEAKPATSVQSRQSRSLAGTQYARCREVKGLLRREKCRWDACDGKWGKQGCPAYQHNAKPELGTGQFGQASQPRAAERTHSDG